MDNKIFLLVLFIGLIVISGCKDDDEAICKDFSGEECLEHQDVCKLCPERAVSSYISCHSKEFCANIPIE